MSSSVQRGSPQNVATRHTVQEPRFRPGRWGLLQVAPRRYGVVRFRLVVLAPGSTRLDHAVLRFADGCVWFGAATWAGIVGTLGPASGPGGGAWRVLVLATVLATLVTWLVHRSGRGVRSTAREAWVCAGPRPVSFGERASDRAAAAAGILRAADELRAAHRMDAVDYEIEWARAWSLLPPRRRRRSEPDGRVSSR